MVTIPFTPYEPDKNRYNVGALAYVNNVVPTVDGYAPLKSIITTTAVYERLNDNAFHRLTTNTGARIVVGNDGGSLAGPVQLPSLCMGMFAARKKNGEEVLFAGTATHLYKFNRLSFTWEDVSSMTYAAAVRWQWVKKGTVVYCQNGHDPEQKFDLEADTDFSDNPTAPICKIMAMVGQFVFRANIVSWAAEGISDEPSMIMCSSLLSAEDNVPQNFNFCDYQSLASGNEIMGIMPVTGGAHVWTKGSVVPLSLQIAEYTFAFGDEDMTRGTSAPYSLCGFGQDRYIAYADDGVWVYNGEFLPIGQDRVNRTLLIDCDQNERDSILAMTDPENAVIWIAYTDTDGERRMIGWQYNLNLFTAANIPAAASIVSRTFVYTMSTPPILLEDQPRFAIIDPDGRLGYLVGDTMAARVMTNEIQLGDDRAFHDGVRLNGDPVDFTVTTITRDIKGGPERTRATASPSTITGKVPVSAEGFTHQWQLDIPAGEPWTNVTGMEVPAKRAGKT